jgi:hypothetical protein
MTLICTLTTLEKYQDVCGVYLDMNNVAIGSTIKVINEVKVPRTTFNLFVRIYFLPPFFGAWTFQIVIH